MKLKAKYKWNGEEVKVKPNWKAETSEYDLANHFILCRMVDA
jgi:hypothetical protein